MAYDVASVRSHFPALVGGAAHFDGPGGSQVPDVVGRAVGGTLISAIANRGRATAAERRADDIVHGARQAMADLLGADASGIVFGRSMTGLTYELSRALAKTWSPGDEVVVTRLDHDANIRPWVQAAEDVGATVRWVDFDRKTADLVPGDVEAVLSPRTRLVAVTAASNLVGTRPDIAAISQLVHATGAKFYVDGVHLTPHAPVDMGALGADFYACSPYKFLGPHCGVVAGRPDLLAELHPDKLAPSTDAVPEKFELGTLPYELLAGTTAAVDFLAGLGSSAGGPLSAASRRDRIVAGMTAVEDYEDAVVVDLEARLADFDRVVFYGRPAKRTPTLLFSVDGIGSTEVQNHLGSIGVNAPAGSFYALEASRRIGLGDAGAVRVGIAAYTDADDVNRLVEGIAQLIAKA